ncbi:hypothetical protein SAMN05421504_103389 [Amycolatopsis xylanica]|uniref:DUF4352 domain-containing protein n=1 Tax=Amycolatopsis xylanica TaxID=589385 RepID=A0A1H3DH40_9PSEU|nr:hypothetical protein [Amycolatopsis xylanica]SDX65650.1 hypothetical protein SAMN05421504_103389 [Amycolatopsis xylanica]
MALARAPRLLPAVCALLAAVACGVPVQQQTGSAAEARQAARGEVRPVKKAQDFGNEHTFADGLSIRVSMPKSFQPSNSSYPRSGRAAAFDVELRNGGTEPYRLSGLSVTASASGAPASPLVDALQGFNGISDAGRDIAPGRAIHLNMAFAVPENPVELWMVLRPSAGSAAAATYCGSA